MIYIIIGHILGFVVVYSMNPIPMEQTVPSYLIMAILILFLESQMIRSITNGVIYFRRSISIEEGSIFKQAQVSYSALAAFIIGIALQNI